jgi:hypothetical protein
MARVWIPIVSAELDALPAVCVKTGEPADRFLALSARARAGWTWWLLPLGVLPFLVVRHFAPEVTVLVPLASGAGRRFERLRFAGLLALAEAVVLAGAGLLGGSRDVLLAGVTFLGAAGLVRTLEVAHSVRATLDLSARGILLSGVHPVFRDEFDGLQRAAWTHATGAMDTTGATGGRWRAMPTHPTQR